MFLMLKIDLCDWVPNPSSVLLFHLITHCGLQSAVHVKGPSLSPSVIFTFFLYGSILSESGPSEKKSENNCDCNYR